MSFIVAANWKMHKSPEEATAFFSKFAENSIPEHVKVLFFVPAVTAVAASQSQQLWGPQNIYPASHGAFTGETSPQVMQGLGAQYALVGHSERRSLFHESNADTNLKVKSAQEFGLSPVLCIGETLQQRKSGDTLEVLKAQLTEGLEGFEPSGELHIAYEPVWAIGTGEVASVEQVSEAHQFIRSFLKERFPQLEPKIQILYGGSVKPGNATELSQAQEVGGFLVGGASLQADSFADIIKAVQG
jgi:triosephosphate isomerase